METNIKTGKNLIVRFCILMLMLGIGIIMKGSSVKAYEYWWNVSTYSVSSYQGVTGTGYGYSGDTTYINLWDQNRDNALHAASVTIYKNGTYDISDSYTCAANHYMNYISFGFNFYNTGEYTYSGTVEYLDGSTGSFNGGFTIYDKNISISGNPSSVTVESGDTAQFSVSASQGTNLSYQWYYNTSNSTSSGYKISGATSSSYSVTTTPGMNGRYYYCVISNYGNQITSNTAKLTVQYAPSITVSSSQVYAYNGDTASFSVSASGGNPSSYSYQWYYASSLYGSKTSISGATSSKYNVTATTAMNGRYYFCKVKNGNISTYSSAMRLYLLYEVRFNANGGTGAPSVQTKYHGTALTLSSRTPTRTGYSFLGWASSATATSANYQAGESYTSNSDITLYAVWKSSKEYKVTYNANGGYGEPSTQIKKEGVTLTLSSVKPSRTGYEFQGWTTSAAGTTVIYLPGNSYSQDADVTLYALWKADKYKITYNANGGYGAPSAQTKTHGTALTLSSIEPKRTDYMFQGWSTSSVATSPEYLAGEKYVKDSDATLYAVWKSSKEYKVTYNANGGYGEPLTQIKKEGVTLTLSSVKPSRTGYEFQGWTTSAAGTTVIYLPGNDYSQDADVTLYALWKADEYKITYNANGGYGAPSAQTKIHGTALTLSSIEPKRTDYMFRGWSTSSMATSAEYLAGEKYTKESDATLYAVWEREMMVTTAPIPTVKPTNIPTAMPDNTPMLSPTIKPTLTPLPTSPPTLFPVNRPTAAPVNQSTSSSGDDVMMSQSVYAKDIILQKGKEKNIGATSDAEGDISYSSNNKKVATISEDGDVRGKGYGKAFITIYAHPTQWYYAASKRITVTVASKKTRFKSVKSNAKREVALSWKKSRDASGYHMYVSTTKNFTAHTFERYLSRKYKLNLSGLKSGKSYYFKIRSFRKVGKKKYCSVWSKVKKVKVR